MKPRRRIAAPKAQTDYALELTKLQQGFVTDGMGSGSSGTLAILSRSCPPLWVKSGHRHTLDRCPLSPRGRPAFGQKRTATKTASFDHVGGRGDQLPGSSNWSMPPTKF